jgi:hypothetical protein
MTKSKTETKSTAKIIFEKLSVEEEKKVRGTGLPDPRYCLVGPPSVLDC